MMIIFNDYQNNILTCIPFASALFTYESREMTGQNLQQASVDWKNSKCYITAGCFVQVLY